MHGVIMKIIGNFSSFIILKNTVYSNSTISVNIRKYTHVHVDFILRITDNITS